MIFFCGKVKDLQPAIERYYANKGRKNIEELVLWFGVCTLEQFDMISLDALPVLNVRDALPVRHKDSQSVGEILGIDENNDFITDEDYKIFYQCQYDTCTVPHCTNTRRAKCRVITIENRKKGVRNEK